MSTNKFDQGEVVRFKPSQEVNAFWWFVFMLCVVIFADSVISIYYPYLKHKYGLMGIPISHLWWMIPILLVCFSKFLAIACWSYEFTIGGDIITEKKGVLTQTSVDVHLFRIKSIKVERLWWMRLFGLVNVIILTSEPFMPVLTLFGITENDDPHPDELSKYFRDSAKYWRKINGVKETDFHSF